MGFTSTLLNTFSGTLAKVPTMMTSLSHADRWIMLALLSLALLLNSQATTFSQETKPSSPLRDEPSSARTTSRRNIALDRDVLFEPIDAAPRHGSAGLFIGVNDFPKDTRLTRLQFAVNDAIEQAYLFVFELKLIPAQNCLVLLSGESNSPAVQKHLEQLRSAGATVSSAERAEILVQLEAARGKGQQATDLLVCSVSSHGFIDGRIPYVMPSDGLKNRLQLTAVSLDTIEGDLEQSRAGHRLLFVDACQERIPARTVRSMPAVGKGMDAAFREAFAKPTGQYKLASCSPTEQSYENPGLGNVGHGLFTHALLEALRGGAPSDDKNLVRLSAVEEYVSIYVTKWAADANLPAQTPFSAGARSSRSLPLAKKADDLATLVASVRRQPLNGGFTAELRESLTVTLSQLDLSMEADRELVTITRNFVNGAFPSSAFVPYLRDELKQRQLGPMPQLIRATFTVHEGSDDRSPLLANAHIELQWRASNDSSVKSLGSATTDRDGRARIDLRMSDLPKSAGRYVARMSKESRRRDSTLENFPDSFSWRLYLPMQTSVAKPGSMAENSIGMKLVDIAPGEFQMGSSEDELEHMDDELPHRVKITRGYYMGVYEVTQSEYKQVMGTNPSRFCAAGDGKVAVMGLDTSRFPVENLTWDDAVEFCRRLSALPAEQAAGRIYRLPTEAEWEYACRASTITPFSWGDSLNGAQANCAGSFPYGTESKGPSLERTTRVGSYGANAWGLFDMHGNVSEWCSDWYDRYIPPVSLAVDPTGPATGSFRSLRGGSWFDRAGSCRSADRTGNGAMNRGNYLGFRVACTTVAP
ncbi:MAG: SUMF1/EgtB/PvdO family nonheme iron enzyme [Pirellulales bacterium]